MYVIIMFLSLVTTSMDREQQQDQSSTDTLSGTYTFIEIYCVPNINRQAEIIGQNE